jgi:hypothetical protein
MRIVVVNGVGVVVIVRFDVFLDVFGHILHVLGFLLDVVHLALEGGT